MPDQEAPPLTGRTCPSLRTIPEESPLPGQPHLAFKLGYPADAVTQCCRLEGHDGSHVAVVPLGENPGSAKLSWETPEVDVAEAAQKPWRFQKPWRGCLGRHPEHASLFCTREPGHPGKCMTEGEPTGIIAIWLDPLLPHGEGDSPQ